MRDRRQQKGRAVGAGVGVVSLGPRPTWERGAPYRSRGPAGAQRALNAHPLCGPRRGLAFWVARSAHRIGASEGTPGPSPPAGSPGLRGGLWRLYRVTRHIPVIPTFENIEIVLKIKYGFEMS